MRLPSTYRVCSDSLFIIRTTTKEEEKELTVKKKRSRVLAHCRHKLFRMSKRTGSTLTAVSREWGGPVPRKQKDKGVKSNQAKLKPRDVCRKKKRHAHTGCEGCSSRASRPLRNECVSMLHNCRYFFFLLLLFLLLCVLFFLHLQLQKPSPSPFLVYFFFF